MIPSQRIRRRPMPAVALVPPKPEVDASEAANDSHKAIIEIALPFVVLATDRIRCGQPILALSESCQHLANESPGRRFARFRTRTDAEAWLHENQRQLDRAAYRYTITDL